MSGTRQGRRLEDGSTVFDAQSGDYWRDERGVWKAKTPNGHYGTLAGHEVAEHEDGTITVSPSILVSNAAGELYHGWLERGVWRSA